MAEKHEPDALTHGSTQQQISIYDRTGDPIALLEKMGKWLAASGMFGIKNQEQGLVVALTCFHERIPPLEFRRRYHIIEGTPTKRADRMHADFLARGGRVVWIEYTDEVCAAQFLHPEFCPKGITIRVTLEEMRKKGITKSSKGGEKDNWRCWPRSMLKARVLSEGIRQVDPGCVAGEYTPEEIADAIGLDLGRPVIDVEGTPVQSAGSSAAAQPDAAEEPPVDTSEPPSPAAPPEGAQEPEQEELPDRAQKVIAAFKVYSVTQEDLEALAGAPGDEVVEEVANEETGEVTTPEVIFAKGWEDDHYAKFDRARKRIKDAEKGFPRDEVIRAIFNLPGGTLG